jgi:hypothetical protein
MKLSATALALLACSSSLALGADLTTLSGKVYHDVEVLTNRCTLSVLVFRHSSGTTKVAFTNMIEQDRVAYGYDAKKEQAFLAAEAKRAADAQAQEAAKAAAEKKALEDRERQKKLRAQQREKAKQDKDKAEFEQGKAELEKIEKEVRAQQAAEEKQQAAQPPPASGASE